MEMCLTARQMGAVEAEQSGLVAQVFPKEELVEKTLKAAEKIAEKSVVATMMIKESINRAFEVSLQEGLRFERRTFHSIFATQDQKEGMQAFVEKRQANFKDN
jgi:Enoyl-CoA hydratase/carnithine racemase